MIPYGHQLIEKDDIEAVSEVLQSDWLTQGPMIEKFEKALAAYCGARFAVVLNSGTAALHAAYYAAGLKTGDEFITSPITFAATANAGVWQGARPIFVDIDPATGNINPDLIEQKITPKTKIIAPVDYSGRPVNMEKINAIAKKHRLIVVEDACQALGSVYKGSKTGSISDLTVFSFHPVKTITTGEGGAVLTNDEKYYRKLRIFRTHGITKENLIKNTEGDWYYEMQELGMNYRITDFQCALGLSQLKKADRFVSARAEIVKRYNSAFANCKNFECPLPDSAEKKSAWHLYVIKLKGDLIEEKAEIFNKLRAAGIGVQVHHIPVYFHPFYQKLGYQEGLCPQAEEFYHLAISLPIYPALTESDQIEVINKIKAIIET